MDCLTEFNPIQHEGDISSDKEYLERTSKTFSVDEIRNEYSEYQWTQILVTPFDIYS